MKWIDVKGLRELPRNRYYLNYFIPDDEDDKYFNNVQYKYFYIVDTSDAKNDLLRYGVHIDDEHLDHDESCINPIPNMKVFEDYKVRKVNKDFVFYAKFTIDEFYELTEDEYRLFILSVQL